MPQSQTKRVPKKKKKNESLELLRAITKSMANAVPFTSQETRDELDDTLSRVGSGLASQYMGEDPDTGEMVSPLVQNLKRSWNADARRKAGLPREKRVMPGMVADTLSVPSLFGINPPVVQDASDLASRIHGGVNEDMGLEAPVGFRQNAADSLGTMLGQVPVPGKAKAQAAEQLGGGALSLMKKYGRKALEAPIEFFSPKIDPSVSNYASGALFGGTMGAAADNPEPIMRALQAIVPQEIPRDPRLPNWRAPGDEEELPDIQYDDLPEVTQLAKGGKISQVIKAFRGLRGPVEGIPEEALRGKARKGYASFASSSPDVASSYANPLEGHDFPEVSGIAPLQIHAKEVIDFPVKADGGFDKFEFDRRAQRLKPGQVLVARQVYDYGPRASRKLDPEMKYSYPSDIYAWNDGTEIKTNIGGGYGKGGKVGALTQMLKAINLNPDSTTLKRVPYQIGEPLEEVLYAVNEGTRKGVLSSDEAKQIKAMLDAGDDEALSEALLNLHQRLQPKVKPDPIPPPRQLPPAQLGQGSMTPEEFDRLVLKRGQ